jgi:hypothetical protein
LEAVLGAPFPAFEFAADEDRIAALRAAAEDHAAPARFGVFLE